jgi:hypothetical protein
MRQLDAGSGLSGTDRARCHKALVWRGLVDNVRVRDLRGPGTRGNFCTECGRGTKATRSSARTAGTNCDEAPKTFTTKDTEDTKVFRFGP